MAEWVLILALCNVSYQGTCGFSQSGAAIESVGGFTTQAECVEAGRVWRTTMLSNAWAMCVKRTGRSAGGGHDAV